MTLKQRIDQLESKRDTADAGPSVIFLRAAEGEIRAAGFVGGGGAVRMEGETESAFMARVDGMLT
jgi:hypothetical protein